MSGCSAFGVAAFWGEWAASPPIPLPRFTGARGGLGGRWSGELRTGVRGCQDALRLVLRRFWESGPPHPRPLSPVSRGRGEDWVVSGQASRGRESAGVGMRCVWCCGVSALVFCGAEAAGRRGLWWLVVTGRLRAAGDEWRRGLRGPMLRSGRAAVSTRVQSTWCR